MQTCMSCNVKSNGMIAIYQHPNGLDAMFHSITDIMVQPEDHLCVPCYDDLKVAHRFKQRSTQNNALRLSSQVAKTTQTEAKINRSSDVSTTCSVAELQTNQLKTEDSTFHNEAKSTETVVRSEVSEQIDNDNFIDNEVIQIDAIEVVDALLVPEQDEEDVPVTQLISTTKEKRIKTESTTTREGRVENKDNEGTSAPVKGETHLPRLPKVHSLMCEYCFMEFELLDDKIEHTAMHQTEAKPFKCIHGGCDAAFKDRPGLRAHVRIHAPVKRYGCRYCAMRFHTLITVVIGNETFILTMQDQRNVIDRRNWYLSRQPNHHHLTTKADYPMAGDASPINNFQSLLAQIFHEVQAKCNARPTQYPYDGNQYIKPFCFHYEKQTDTEDLAYYQNRDRLAKGERVIKHVHYYVESAVKSVATNTSATEQRIEETDDITDMEDLEPGMIAIYQHPRGVDRLWTYVTGIMVKSKDQLCIPCYDELRIAHRFKQKCIHNNINRVALELPRRSASHTQQDTPTSEDSISAPLMTPEPLMGVRLGESSSYVTVEECHQQISAPSRNDVSTTGRHDFVIKSEALAEPEDPQEQATTDELPNESVSLLNDSIVPTDESGHHYEPSSALDVVKMELELSLDDIGLRAESLSADSMNDEPEEEKDAPCERKEHVDPSADTGAVLHCAQCEQMFHTRAALKQHQQHEHKKLRRDNTNAVKFRRVLSGKINALMCRYCYREFEEPEAKALHEKTHLSDPKPFQCSYDDCNRLFQNRSALNRHFYTHVIPKRFKCSVCPKRFHQQSSMVVHERLHRGDKPHICPQCGKGFTHVSNVKRHIRFHNGEKPYQCGKCPARFTTSTDLRRHMNSRRCMMMWALKAANATMGESAGAATSTTPSPGAFQSLARNNSYVIPGLYDLNVEDTNWVLTSSFIIFTMQTGFGMLESGCVSVKNEVNIMMKNIIDIVLGGFTYWLFGYAMAFGRGELNNPFVALGDFLIDPGVSDPLFGPIFAAFLFQLSFSTTATTIVSGAMAERCNFKAYCIFSFFNTIVYCIPAGWVWGEHGFLKNLGVVDIAGSGPVHLIGGASAFASAAILGPRLGRYAKGTDPLPLGNPVNACMGLFVLWWGWLAFNSGSTYGVSGAKWAYAARAAVMTMMGSFGGGSFSIIYSMINNDGRMDVVDLINGILASLVSVTAGCYLYHAWEAILIGAIGSALCCFGMPLFDRMGVDDPVGASSVHGIAGIWGVLAVGLFADNPLRMETTSGRSGLFKGGGWYMLGVQSLSALCLACWGVCSTFVLLWLINKVVPIRMDPNEELLGADLMEHRIRHTQIGISRALSALAPIQLDLDDVIDAPPIGRNPGHERCVDEIEAASQKLQQWRQAMDKFAHRSGKERTETAAGGPSPRRRTKSFMGKSHRNGKDNAAFDRSGITTVKMSGAVGEGKEAHKLSVIGSEQSYQVGGTDRNTDRNFAWID
uniref:C2H2-type domain-containing protein n=1 Tax=Anopheles epiroticus TaxID=199890 RepID=A0A182PF20_9DIPT